MLDIWNIIDEYFNQDNSSMIIQHQLKSFDHFIESILPQIIEAGNPLVVKREDGKQVVVYTININNPVIAQPIENDTSNVEMYPNQARIQNLTYSGNLFVDIQQHIQRFDLSEEETIADFNIHTNEKIPVEKKTVNFTNVNIGKIPIMIRSKFCRLFDKTDNVKYNECELDKGGYFIIKGQEKVIISQERFADNQLFVFHKKQSNKYTHYSEIKSIDPITKVAYGCYIRFLKNETLRVKIPQIKDDVCLISLMKILNPTLTDKAIIDIILLDEPNREPYIELLLNSFHNSKTVDELDLIFKAFQVNQIDKVNTIFDRVLLPHTDNRTEFLGLMAKQILDVIVGKRSVDDRDHLANKRIDSPGVMMGYLFKQLYQKFLTDLAKDILNPNSQIDINRMIKSCTIGNGFSYGLSTGNWLMKNGNLTISKVGVAQMLNRFNFYSTLSHLRRIVSDLDPTAKLIRPRQLHPSHIFSCCPNETPEGGSIGISKNLALASSITIDHPDYFVLELLNDLNMTDTFDKNSGGKIFVNSKLVGMHTDIVSLAEKLKMYRRRGELYFSTSVFIDYDMNELFINTDGGRVIRPVFLVQNNKLMAEKLSTHQWENLVRNGVIDFIDVKESENCLIAISHDQLPNANYTHCELHPSLMLGICASLIPFANHNQSPRVSYQSAMCKQALGVYTTNFKQRMDSNAHILWNPQKPIVSTKMGNIMKSNELPSGQNCIVAFGCYTGLFEPVNV